MRPSEEAQNAIVRLWGHDPDPASEDWVDWASERAGENLLAVMPDGRTIADWLDHPNPESHAE